MADTCLRIYFDNYVDLDILADSDVSSEKSGFPVTNAYNSQRRSKVWRSDGYYLVDSTNKDIVLRETSGGPNITATITEGEYSSISAFAAAIASALNSSAGASTYTVTNTLALGYRFQIVSNGSGGDGSFHLMLTDAAFTAAGLLGFDDSTDLTDAGLTRLADLVRINSEEFIEWDLGVSSNPKGFAVIGPRNTPLKLSPGGTYKLQGNHTSNWTSPAFETTLTYNDNALYVTDSEGLASTYLRFWRFLMDDKTNSNGYLEVGAFALGMYFSPDRGRAQFPLNISLVDRSEILFSEGGQSYADIKPKTAEYSITWAGLKKEDIEEMEDQFARYGTGKPFFVAIDSGAIISTSSQRRLIFCNFASAPSYTLISPNNWELSMNLREAL